MIKGTTKLLGIVGYPVEHSMSPIMHNAAIAHLGVDYVYVPFPVAPDQLASAYRGFQAIGIQGFNLTIPHKQAIIPLLDNVSKLATAVGAVNTVWYSDKGWSGTNTDVAGFLAPLKALNCPNWHEKIAVILGNGGASRAVVAGCAELGMAEIHIVGRNPQKLEEFKQSWLNSPLPIKVNVHNWQELNPLIKQADLLVNTTPVGMSPHIDRSPVDAENFEGLKSGAIAYDLIYTPRPTRFLQLAKNQGAVAIDGLEMLIQQGAAALEIWLQQPIPISVMRQSLIIDN
ncbi:MULTISPECIES: shikimate dehydrogenase [Arthrospira]|uniref:Shikimate dehydrogenase (NADP(+)) n=1 Tax=Limnospira platensis NIES-46 TaxID=1236695 RepID=A0A5M3T715_LIMPL|nr:MULTISPECIES: shikimate dehydrogenase [Arthrospira]AMW31192.1 shikimate dehydrogenase [Arthrospira platensis YZ]MBD2669644.1 shikimate dehydrogenase [Arthrospira platensis FACHB-439]MBD2709809.1 shikimate dehydrogenase [Arthrospira platensis FACHB-835]MDF2208616.1 shikimate dehydrogenase [Arthrospira platensis NCB002]MDT9182393.1 shikimate dehydrogenase [Limnospira sp. PMC 289.06]MDT9294583.1 shikimate dehydrogenase [Arthrospira platensis PCC 7345]QQW32272.1 shikimate dehydrogenase [Arthr